MSLVPRSVLSTIEEYYRDFPGCAGRSLHRFATEVGRRYEEARERFARFLHAEGPDGIVFVRNATEALNLVGQGISWKAGDRVLVSDQEHNSNLVLWQRLREERGIRLEILPLPEDGSFDSEEFERCLGEGVRLVSFFHTSNLDGRSLPVREIVERAHRHGALVLLDGCQAAPHGKVDLQRIGADFYAVSAHKMMGPTGTGVLAARTSALRDVRPLMLGGETVEWTTLTDHELRPIPHRFEAGLQNYAGILGAAAGIDFLDRLGVDEVHLHEMRLNTELTRSLANEPRVELLGPTEPAQRASIYAFNLSGIDPNDGALFLDSGYDVMVRSGRHCVHSWYERRGLSGNLRASFYAYNSLDDVRRLVRGVRELIEKIPQKREAVPRRAPPPLFARH